jgi:hypothetical protein
VLAKLEGLTLQQAELVKAVHKHLANILFLSAFFSGIYWVLFGLLVSCRLGSPCSLWSLVAGLPFSLALAGWQLLAAGATLNALLLLDGGGGLRGAEGAHHHTVHAANQVNIFFRTWGPWIVASYTAAAAVEILTTLLPFLLVRLPRQPVGGEGAARSVGCLLIGAMAAAQGGKELPWDAAWAGAEGALGPALKQGDFLAGGVSIFPCEEERVEVEVEEREGEELPLTPLLQPREAATAV